MRRKDRANALAYLEWYATQSAIARISSAFRRLIVT